MFRRNRNQRLARSTDELSEFVPRPSGTTFIDIISYNNYLTPKEGLAQLEKIYDNLFNYGLWLSGFQFVGLVVDSSEEFSNIRIVGNFLLTLGLLVSIFSALMAFVSVEYFKGIEGESNEFIFIGLQKYKHVFRLSDLFLFVNTFLFAAAVNTLVHDTLPLPYCIVLNSISGVAVVVGIFFHYQVIVSKQEYTEGDEFITNLFTLKCLRRSEAKKVSRRIYERDETHVPNN